MNRELKKLFKNNYTKIPLTDGLTAFIGNRRVMFLANTYTIRDIESDLGIGGDYKPDKLMVKKMKGILKAAETRKYTLKSPVLFEQDKASEYAACYTQAKEYLAFRREGATIGKHDAFQAFIIRKHEYDAFQRLYREQYGKIKMSCYGFLLNCCPAIVVMAHDEIAGFIFCEQQPKIQWDGESLTIEGLKIKGV